MKWIGQHIWDRISRFRSDIYLEDISSGTIASGGNLGLDSNNKIVKQSDTGITDLHGAGVDGSNLSVLTDAGDGTITSNTYIRVHNDAGESDTSTLELISNQDSGDKFTIGTTTHGATTITTIDDDATAAHLTHIIDGDIKYQPRNGSTYFYKGTNLDDYLKLDIDNNGAAKFTTVDAAATAANFEIEADGNIILDAAGNITLEADDIDTAFGLGIVHMESALEGKPLLTLKTTHTTWNKAAELQFLKDADDTGDDEALGTITFYGEDSGSANTKFAQIKGAIAESSAGQEGGKITFAVATHDGELRNGLIINDGNVEDEVDVTIGDTATSLTTISGTLTMGTTAFVNNSGVIQVATQGTIDHDSLANWVDKEHIDWTASSAGTIHATNYTNTTYSEATSSDEGLMSTAHHDKLDGIETGADVTDATNVTAAGALMDSECSSLASVKALDQGVATGDSPQFAGINLGHASDTTFARSASGVATIESNIIQTKNKVIHIEQGTLSDNIDTTEHFFPAVTTAESTSFTNVVTPFLMPVAGKLLKIHLKTNQNHNTSSNEVTFKLYDLDDGENWNDANKTLLGTKVISGTAKATVMVADFQDLTTTGASGTNAFQAGDLIGISLQNSQNLNITTKYVWSFVFELDFNSY